MISIVFSFAYKSTDAGSKVSYELIKIIRDWSEYFSDTSTVFPRLSLYEAATQTRPSDDYFQGSWRVLDLDYCGLLWIWTNTPSHLLTLSPHPLLSSEPPSLPSQHPFVPPPILSPVSSTSLHPASTLSSTNHIEMPAMTREFDPEETPKPWTHMRHLLPYPQGGDD